MSEHIVLIRMQRGAIVTLTEGEDYAERVAVFPSEEAAEECILKHPLHVFPYQIVELEI